MSNRSNHRQTWPSDAFSGGIDPGPSLADRRRAWHQLIATIAILAILAALLPWPWSTGAGSGTTGSAGSQGGRPALGADVVQGVVLQVCAITVWLLLVWAVLVAVAAGLARIPGRPGRLAGNWLSKIAPAAVRRVLITAVGLTVITGVAGCATTTDTNASNIRGTAAVAGSAAQAGPRLPSVDDAQQEVRLIGAGTAGEPSSPDGGPGAQHCLAGQSSPDGGLGPAAIVGPLAGHEPQLGSWSEGGSRHLGGHESSVEAGSGAGSGSGSWGIGTAPGSGTGSGSGNGGSGTGSGSGNGGSGTGSGSGMGINLDWPSGPTGPKSGTHSTAVVVMRGDSLWRIAARHLPAGADDAQIDSAWRAWYETNRTVIGANPDLILPGQQLLPPSSGTGISS